MLSDGWVTQSWDTAIKAGPGHDASACVTVRFANGRHCVVDVTVLRAEYPELKRRMQCLALKFAPQAILIEDKASGQSLLQDLRQEGHWPVLPIMPKGDKLTRVARVTPMLEAGLVSLPERAAWLAAFEAELLEFPNGAHDDQVDALAQYLNWVREKGAVKPSLRGL
jgi:predicted phage terminase large subunit-like protein